MGTDLTVLHQNDDALSGGRQSEIVFEAVAGTKPCAPLGLTVEFVPDDTLSLDWYDNEEYVDHYNVYRGPSEDGPFSVIGETVWSEYDDTGLAPGEYCYQIKAAFGPGDEAEGNESGTVCETVPSVL